MDTPTVGVRELKAHLSHHLKRVRAGRRLVITERGRPIALINPLPGTNATDWAHALVDSGRARWAGGKPEGLTPPVPIARGVKVSDAVIEDRR